eukprot:TRINITY_DN92401_c0_g1_i1.p1 TRINITY_DN92401_c0_g1~~TRINITY_DN92401_c0_g1_i1.p1  ORF type:complete len:553 (+),score=53.58 TRINITY_DN92401_c0_g1_i1:61-1719(+)
MGLATHVPQEDAVPFLENCLLRLLEGSTLQLDSGVEMWMKQGSALSMSQVCHERVCDYYVRIMRPLFYRLSLADKSRPGLQASVQEGVFLRQGPSNAWGGFPPKGGKRQRWLEHRGLRYQRIDPQERHNYRGLYNAYKDKAQLHLDMKDGWLHEFVSLQTALIPWTVHLILSPNGEIVHGWSSLEVGKVRIMRGMTDVDKELLDRFAPRFNPFRFLYAFEMSDCSLNIEIMDWGASQGDIKKQYGARGKPVDEYISDCLRLPCEIKFPCFRCSKPLTLSLQGGTVKHVDDFVHCINASKWRIGPFIFDPAECCGSSLRHMRIPFVPVELLQQIHKKKSHNAQNRRFWRVDSATHFLSLLGPSHDLNELHKFVNDYRQDRNEPPLDFKTFLMESCASFIGELPKESIDLLNTSTTKVPLGCLRGSAFLVDRVNGRIRGLGLVDFLGRAGVGLKSLWYACDDADCSAACWVLKMIDHLSAKLHANQDNEEPAYLYMGYFWTDEPNRTTYKLALFKTMTEELCNFEWTALSTRSNATLSQLKQAHACMPPIKESQ